MCDLFGSKRAERDAKRQQNQAKRDADEAKKKEAERQARIAKGMADIKAAFEGRAATHVKKNTFDTGKIKTKGAKSGSAVAGLPAGYKLVQLPSGGTAVVKGAARQNNRPSGGLNNSRDNNNSGMVQQASGDHWRAPQKGAGGGGGGGGGGGVAAAPGKWMVQGPDGKMYEVGDDIVYNTGKESAGTANPFNKLYKEYGDASNKYYLGDVADQYADARDETTFRLARAGTLQSSAALDAQADINKQNTNNILSVKSNTEDAVGDLKRRVAQDRANAENMVQTVEDPTVSVNQALASTRNLLQERPALTPLGEVFKVAAIGGANALSGFQGGMSTNRTNEARRKYNTNIVS